MPTTLISFKQEKFTRQDISQVVGIHRQEIGQGFLSSLGDRTLNLIFSLSAQGESGVLITAMDPISGQICGFVCGTTDTSAFYRDFLRRHLFTGTLQLAPKLLSPARLWRVMETLIYPTRKIDVDLPEAELLIIAVADTYKGRGVAQALFYELVKVFSEKRVPRFKVVAGASLARAQRFYQKLGPAKRASIEVHRGQLSTVYIFNVAEQYERITREHVHSLFS